MSAPVTAFVFPGQGPQHPSMLDGLREDPRYPLLVATLGEDPVAGVERHGAAWLNRNEVASAVTLFCSAVEIERLAKLGVRSTMAAGYSVGQWSAMVCAGMLSLEEALGAVRTRAQYMNDAPASRDGAMLAVIGLKTDTVAAVCADVAAAGETITISNFNCLGQLTLAGTRSAIAQAEARLAALKPRKLQPLGLSGAWHCHLLDAAAEQFREWLSPVRFAAPTMPVADNVTGAWLPQDPASLQDTLAAHLCSAVQWESCVRKLAAEGAQRFVEVGFGDMLTKFGFFIDRSREHVPSSKVS